MNAAARARPRRSASARLLPALMATLGAILGLKAVALAQGVAEAQPSAPQPAQTASAAPAQSAPAPASAQCPQPGFAEQAGLSQAEVQVLQALGARRQALDARAGQMDTETQLLAAAERRLEERLAELRRLETSVNGLLGQLDQQQAQRVSNLVDVYQRMRARDAAVVFDQLDEETLVLVASRMRQQNLAEVMGRMQPDRARRLTQLLAELSQRAADTNRLLASAAPPAPARTPPAQTPAPAPAR